MRKIVSIIVCMLVCLSSVLIVPNEIKVKASGEGGGEGDDTGLDYDFVWNVTKLLCNVTFDAYENEPFSRGRGWATKGENYTIEKILIPYMEGIVEDDYCNLTGVTTLPLGHLDDFDDHYYTSKVEAIDFNLNVNNVSYPFENPMPKTEIFPVPSARRCCIWPYKLNGTYWFNETRIFKSASEVWPFAGALNPNYHCNLSGSLINNYCAIIGNATYVSSVDDLPDDQEDRVFIMNESDGCGDILDNLTNATCSILIHNNSLDYSIPDATKYNFSVARINDTDDNFSEIQDRLESGEAMLVDNVVNDSLVTFTYNLSEGFWPDLGHWFLILDIATPENCSEIWGWWGFNVSLKSAGLYFLNRFHPFSRKCLGLIIYDYNNDTHFMGPVSRTWKYRYSIAGFGIFAAPFPSLPVFSINGTVGSWLENNRSGTTISGYMEQKFRSEKNGTGVNSSNVVGYRNTSNSPNDSIVIISSRMDGWWGPTPGDAGVGNAIILGIAKYFNDYDITPKYNLTFLYTTGEDYGKRGAYHYRDSHPDENFSLWIGTDQLAWDQNDSFLEPQISDKNSDKTNYSIVWQIVNDTNYSRTGYNCNTSFLGKDDKSGAEDDVWMKRCTTICFGKDAPGQLTQYHRAGMNYTEGDVLKYIDRNDTNATFEVVWSVIKYFTVNPDCWFDSYSETKLDSPDDGDYLNDSIKATFTVKSILPHDLVMVHAMLNNSAELTVNETNMSFTVNSTGRQESVTLTIPENEPPGNYTLFLELYNSTGRINEIVEIGDNNYNDTTPSPFYFVDMYPYNFDKFPSEITNVSATPSPVGFGFSVTISADVTDNASYVNNVSVNITYPNNNTENFTMTNTGGDTYEYVFSDTWLVGQYNYTIWTLDNSSNSNSSSGHSFDVSAQANISVCTIKDEYGNNETINLTDPPGIDPPLIGYELLDDGDVLHMWNEYNSYYFNTSSGIQLTNHYDEYWSHNVLMLGYYDDGEWNLIYRTDELSGFNKDINSDNETYVNATLWKDLTYGGYDFRLAVRYHLDVDDFDLTVIPHIKNLGDAIPYNLGFGWEIKDIKIADNYENDSIRLYNGTDWINYSLDQTLDNKYTDMDYNTTFILEGLNEGKYFRRTLYLRWNHTLDYLLWVKSRTGQYNAPVTLFIKVGTLGQNQEKYTVMNWLDSDAWLGVSGWNYHSSCGHTWPDNPWGALNGTGIWAHMTTENHWLVIDLNETYNIKKIRGRSNTPDDPTSVDIYISDDPDSWGPAVETGITTWQDTDNWAEVNITDTVGRYINISITSTEGMAGDDYLEFGKLPTPMTIFDVYGEEVSTATYYFNSYDNNKAWATNPSYMVDGSTSTYAATSANGEIELCDGNTCSGTNLGTILKVELRVYGYYSGAQRDIILRPVFGGPPGSDYTYQTTSTAGWSQWFNITDDNSAPGNWDWTDVSNLDCEVQGESGIGIFTLYCSKVEMRVIYDPVPGFSDPYPANGSIGISISPTLNITVSDADGDLMNLTWYSNSSGSWQVFGTNNSVGNGTYHQTFSNATENGKWWYWKVNVSDGTSYNESSVYKFYTGYQSKIKNTGSTSIKGYLLIQVQCYNTSSVTWAVADDTINEASPRTIYWDGPDTPDQNILALDTIFNGLVNTSNLSSYGNGTYRIYAAFRDPDGNILVTDDETELVATYEFDITFD